MAIRCNVCGKFRNKNEVMGEAEYDSDGHELDSHIVCRYCMSRADEERYFRGLIAEDKKTISHFMGRVVEVFDGKKWETFVIQNLVPMHNYYQNRTFISPTDVEVILDKKTNTYFSIERFLKGKSWVKDIKLHNSFSEKFKTNTISKRYNLHAHSLSYTARMISKLDPLYGERKRSSIMQDLKVSKNE